MIEPQETGKYSTISEKVPTLWGTHFKPLLSFQDQAGEWRPRCWWGKGELLTTQIPGSSETGIRFPQRNRNPRKKTYSEEGFNLGFLRLRETIHFVTTLVLCTKHLWHWSEGIMQLQKWLSEWCQVKGYMGTLQLLAWLRDIFFLLGAVSVSYDDVDFLV